jgi:hypothetical protein
MKALNAYENEDGDIWFEVAEYPDQAIAGQAYADERGMIASFDGGVYVPLQECECYEQQAECPDGKEYSRRPWRHLFRREWHKEPCRFRTNVQCWHFYSGESPTDFDEGSELYFPHDAQGRTLILGHPYKPDDYQHSPKGYCSATEQEHYREHIEAPGQISAFDEAHHRYLDSLTADDDLLFTDPQDKPDA